jgi:hypothetical protein
VRRAWPGLRIHRAALAPDQVTTHRAIPVTTPARTVLDLAANLSGPELARAGHEAEARRLGSATSLAELADRHRGRPCRRSGACSTSTAWATRSPRSELEDRFLAVVDATRLPRPRVNGRIELPAQAPFEAHFAWPRQRVLVELDGSPAPRHTR